MKPVHASGLPRIWGEVWTGWNTLRQCCRTNRLDVLDPALLRHGRIDRKIEITLPNRKSRMEIFKIHAEGVTKRGEIDYEAVVKLAEVD